MGDERNQEAGPPTEVGLPAGTRRIAGTLLQRGGTIDRFVVERLLGEGGAGVVVLARDPHLDRPVAVKLLRPVELARDGSGEARVRLLREAQAIARLKHPNVVTVYQAGEVGGQVFLAMEYVAGGTLREWLAAAPHPWKEIVRRFRLAGRGLAAAHAAGMVHRDFKPDNVLVADDGNALVTDFGLVGVPRRGEGERPPDADPAEPDRALTRTGAVLGTPCYMAPEQARGELDARADQFSFCAALHEALCGQLPFAGESAAELAAEIEAGRVRPPPPGTAAPSWLLAAVLRGLRPDPDARYPSMETLLRALDPERRAARRTAAIAVVGLLIAGGSVAGWAMRRGDPPPPAASGTATAGCVAPEASFTPVEPGRRWLFARGGLVRDGELAPAASCQWRNLDPAATVRLALDYHDPRCCSGDPCGPPPDGPGHRCVPAGDRRWSCEFRALAERRRSIGGASLVEWFAPDVGAVRRTVHGQTDDLVCFTAPCGTPEASLMPLAVGNWWRYRVVDPASGRTYEKTIEIDRRADIGGDKAGTVAYRLLRRDDRGGATRWLRELEAGIVWEADVWYDGRGRMERSTIYRPYRLRAPEGCRNSVAGARWTEEYEQIDVAADGSRTATRNRERWEVAGIEEVTVPAGRFRALRFHRLNDERRIDSMYWFAPGVGKVKEDSPPKESEVLIGYHLAPAATAK